MKKKSAKKSIKKSVLTMAGVACALMGTLASAGAQSVTLYDGASGQTLNQAPWNWTYAQLPSMSNVSGTAQGGATNLNTTTANSLMAGYSLLSPVPLDNAAGYDMAFDLQVVSEAHNRVDRSGVSMIVLGSDNKGVELAFWNNEVWTQTDLFTHSGGTESSPFDTTALTHYDLVVANDAYTLAANGTTLLTGSLHSYAGGPARPYHFTNYLFIGDDTTSANGNVNISRVALVPEPGGLASLIWLSVTGTGWALQRKRRHSAQKRQHSTQQQV